MPRNLVTVITIWLVSVAAAIALFLIVDATLATGEFLGFKVAGGLAGAIVSFLLLFRSYRALGRTDLQVHFVFEADDVPPLDNAKVSYRVMRRPDTWVPTPVIKQFDQRFVRVPAIGFDDVVQVRVDAKTGSWISDLVESRVRHLLFVREGGA